jgi:hypothetical protein
MGDHGEIVNHKVKGQLHCAIGPSLSYPVAFALRFSFLLCTPPFHHGFMDQA